MDVAYGERFFGTLLFFAPLLGFIINFIILAIETWKKKRINLRLLPGFVGSLSVFISFVASLKIFHAENFILEFFTWIPLEGAKINIKFSALYDELSKTALLYITGVSTLIHIYSIGYMAYDRSFTRYFAFLNLFVFFMIDIVVADDLLQMFLGWEGVGLCSYLLIGFWYSDYQNSRAGFKAFITNRIGDFGFIVGIALMLIYGGTLDVSGVEKIPGDKLFAVAFFLFMGAMGKSAQGPLWLWLPDAMRGPTPVSALIHAATMVTAGVYMVIRLGGIFLTPQASNLVFWIGATTSVLTGFFGIFERDIKRVLAFSTLSQLGLMFCGAVTSQPYTGMYHVFEHSFFKAALFLIAGILMHEFDNETDIYRLKERHPASHGLSLSTLGWLIGSLAMSGVFPLSGFWSKEPIISAVSERFNVVGYIMMLLASFITPLYMFRVFFIVFGQKIKFSLSPSHEGGSLMFYPVLILVLLSIVGGAFNVGHWLGEKYGYTPEHRFAITDIVFIHLIIAISIFIAYFVWGKGREIGYRGLGKILWNKFYLNEVEEKSFFFIASFFMKLIYSFFEMLVIEGFYAFLSLLTRMFGFFVSLFHGGEPAKLVILFIIGILVLILLI